MIGIEAIGPAARVPHRSTLVARVFPGVDQRFHGLCPGSNPQNGVTMVVGFTPPGPAGVWATGRVDVGPDRAFDFLEFHRFMG